jgi:carboxymethylenebutenolidase
MLPFSASVIFYGANPKPIESVSNISGPVLAFYAGEDAMVDAGIPAIIEAMVKYKKTFAMKLYKGVQHAFFNETSSVYNKEAAEDAWQMAIVFFNRYLL